MTYGLEIYWKLNSSHGFSSFLDRWCQIGAKFFRVEILKEFCREVLCVLFDEASLNIDLRLSEIEKVIEKRRESNALRVSGAVIYKNALAGFFFTLF